MYSPKIRKEFIPVLYRMAKNRKKPMMAIVNDMIAEALKKLEMEVNDASQGQRDIEVHPGKV